MKAVLLVIMILLVSSPATADMPPPDVRLLAVLVSNDGQLVGFVLSVHSLQVYLDSQARTVDVRYQARDGFEYDHSPDDEVEAVAGIPIKCRSAGMPERIGLVEFTYASPSSRRLLSAGNLRITADYVRGAGWHVTGVDGIRIEYEPFEGRVTRVGGASFDYGPFKGPITKMTGVVREAEDVVVSIVSDLCSGN